MPASQLPADARATLVSLSPRASAFRGAQWLCHFALFARNDPQVASRSTFSHLAAHEPFALCGSASSFPLYLCTSRLLSLSPAPWRLSPTARRACKRLPLPRVCFSPDSAAFCLWHPLFPYRARMPQLLRTEPFACASLSIGAQPLLRRIPAQFLHSPSCSRIPQCTLCPEAIWLQDGQPSSMAKKRSKKQKKSPSPGPQGPEWAQSVAAGLEEARAGPRSTFRPGHAGPSRKRAASEDPEEPAAEASASSAAAGSAGLQEAQHLEKCRKLLLETRKEAQIMHRTTDEGLLCTGFEPQRHSVMVLGRPVQACPPPLVPSFPRIDPPSCALPFPAK